MKSLRVALLAGAVVFLALPGPQDLAQANGGKRSFDADLDGFDEIPMALSTTGSGEFRVKISRDEQSFEYKLSYEDLEGTVTQAHIHFGRRGVNGGITIWLCGTTSNPGPAGTPTCPSSGEVTGTVTPADVVGPAGQGISPGQFEEVLKAMREGATYANVHSTLFPGGEIRGQIESGRH